MVHSIETIYRLMKRKGGNILSALVSQELPKDPYLLNKSNKNDMFLNVSNKNKIEIIYCSVICICY